MVAGTSVLAALSVLLHVPLSFEPPMTDEYMELRALMRSSNQQLNLRSSHHLIQPAYEVFQLVHLRGSEFRAVSNPIKKLYDPNQSMDFKMDLIYFQQAKNGEKSPRKYGVMAQLRKPVNPVLQLSNLESHRFHLSLTKQWRPGEVSKHFRSISSDSGGVEEFLPCTKAHMIRRIYL
ncbi:hypothetical protein F2Q69_00045973 [Brassica cretica]|uniref:Uncharacterized protein n=1 Tax=Brassica cretica TaxID=69181 RepID=A0A8S9PLR7_BRACR|nr:hypothetical protein F2Q69_00045973 [Brassica cretica]